MTTNDTSIRRNDWSSRANGLAYGTAAEIVIRLAVLAILLIWCFRILQPFILPTLWGVIIAVAIHPLYRKLVDLLGGRRGLAAALVSGAFFALLLVPTVMLTRGLVHNVATLAQRVRDDQLSIPLPPAGVRDWPLIGEFTANLWTTAATNLADALARAGGAPAGRVRAPRTGGARRGARRHRGGGRARPRDRVAPSRGGAGGGGAA